MKKNIAPYPAACDTCSIITYCSIKCRDMDAKSHAHECEILAPLWLSNVSITCLLSLKAITQKPYELYKKLKNKIETDDYKFKANKENPYKSQDYFAFRSLGKFIPFIFLK